MHLAKMVSNALALAIIASLIMSACSSSLKTVEHADKTFTAAIVNDVRGVVKNDVMTAIEIEAVDLAFDKLNSFYKKWVNPVASQMMSDADMLKFNSEFAAVVINYHIVDKLVARDYEKYSLQDRIILLDARSRAALIMNDINDINSDYRKAQRAAKALEYVKAAMKVLVAL